MIGDDRTPLPDDLKRVLFYGASDDLIEVEGDIPGCDEYPGEEGQFELCGLRVLVQYNDNGCWSISVGQIDEDVPVTAEALSLGVDRYSMRLEVLVPLGSHITRVR